MERKAKKFYRMIIKFVLALTLQTSCAQVFPGSQQPQGQFQQQAAGQFGGVQGQQPQFFQQSLQNPPQFPMQGGNAQFQGSGPTGGIGGPFGQQPPLGSQGFAGTSGVAGGTAPGLKIVYDVLPFEKASHAQQIAWQEPTSLPVYCISSGMVQEIRFTCPTCYYNASGGIVSASQQTGPFQSPMSSGNLVDQFLASQTVDMTALYGAPALKLNPMQISGEIFDRQKLQCIGYYGQPTTGSIERPNVTADSYLTVYYVSRPRIVDLFDHGPLLSPSGNRFYAPQTGVLTLKCLARGNPSPSMYQWQMSGRSVSNSPQYQISGSTLQTAILLSCKVAGSSAPNQQSAVVNWQTSDEVIVEPLIGPGPLDNNFESVSKSGIKDVNTGKVHLGQTAHLQCTGGSSSHSYIMWMHQPSRGHILNASCDGGSRTTDGVPQKTLLVVTSACSISFNSFEKSGDYWCSVCSFIADNSSVCNPPINSYASGAVSFELTGPPMISPFYRIERTPNSERTILYFTYCADTLPTQNEIYFMMGKEQLNLNSRYAKGAIQSGSAQENQTYPRCQDVPLSFENNAALSMFNTIWLNINPAQGQLVQQQFNLQQAVNASYDAYANKPFDPTALIIGLCLGAALILAIIITVCCWYKRLCCFSTKRNGDKPSKMGGVSSSKPAKYQPPGLPSSQLRPDVPHEKVVPLARTNNGFGSDRPLPGGMTASGYSPPKKTPHEGLTYSEFDLVKDSSRLVPGAASVIVGGGGSRVVEYSRMQAVTPASIKSPTNSIV